MLFLMGPAALGCTSASLNLHKTLLQVIMHAPMAFFDSTPLGRIMNRFSKDLDTIDTNMPTFLMAYLYNVVPLATTAFVVSYTTPIFIVAVIPIALIYFIVLVCTLYNNYYSS